MAAVQERGGVLSLEDLSAHRCEHRDPLMSTYRGYYIYEVAPPTAVSLWLPSDPTGKSFIYLDLLHYLFIFIEFLVFCCILLLIFIFVCSNLLILHLHDGDAKSIN